MAVLSVRDLEKTAAPMGVAPLPAGGRTPGRSPGRTPGRSPGAPSQRPPSAMTSAPGGAQEPDPEVPGGMQEEPPMAEEQNGDFAPDDLQETVKVLQRYFSDRKISDISNRLQALIPVVGPDHSEKIAKVYAKFMESVAILKATLASMAVLAAPQQEVAKNLRDLMQMQPPGAGMGGGMPQAGGPAAQQNTIKSQPIT